jgi:hypothetical protein
VRAVLASTDDIFELAQRDDATEPDDAVDAPVMALAEPDELVDVVGCTGQEDTPAPTAALSPHNTVEVHTRLPDAEEIAGAENIMTRRLPQTDAGVAASVFRAANDPDWRMPRKEPAPFPTWLPRQGQPWTIFRGYTFERCHDARLTRGGGSFVQAIMRERGLTRWTLGPRGLWWLIFRWFVLRSRQLAALEAAVAARSARRPYDNRLPELGYLIVPQRAFAESARGTIWDLRAYLRATAPDRAVWQLRPVDLDDLPQHQWDVAWFETRIKESGFPNLDLATQLVRRGLRINARCPRHVVLATNYASADQHLEMLQRHYAAERAAGILDPRGAFPGPPFLPVVILTQGAATRPSDGKVRPTIDPLCVRGVLEAWADSWVPADLLAAVRATWPPVPPDDATPEQQQLFFAVCAKLTRAAVLRAAADGPDGVHEPAFAAPGPPAAAVGPPPRGRRPWVDGMPISVNDHTDIRNDDDFAAYALPTVFGFGHAVEIFRHAQMPFGVLKCDWEGWFRQMRWDCADLWQSCWMSFSAGADCDLAPNFGGGGCATIAQGAETLLIWLLYDALQRRHVTDGWGDLPDVQRWTADRRAASAARGIRHDSKWAELFNNYKIALAPIRLRDPWDPDSPAAQQVALCQARLRERERQLGYHGWQPARNEATFCLAGYIDDTFGISLSASYRAVFEEILVLRDRGRVRAQDKKLEARLPPDIPELQIDVASSDEPLRFGPDASPIDILGTDLDVHAGVLQNSPARLDRAEREVAAIVDAASLPSNPRGLVDVKTLLALIGFLFFLFDRACPALRPWLNRPCRAARVVGGLRRRRIFDRAPLPPASQQHLREVCATLRAHNYAALQPRHGPLGDAAGGDVLILHHDAAGAPECGAEVFYILGGPDALRGGGSWFIDAAHGTVGIMTRFPAAWLTGLSSTVAEYAVANAHLECVLAASDAPTILEVTDNLGCAQAIRALRGHTPRMAALSIWRRDILLRYARRVVTIHRKRTANVPADQLSKGEWAAFADSMRERGFPAPAGKPWTASDAALARIQQVFELPPNDADDDVVDDDGPGP